MACFLSTLRKPWLGISTTSSQSAKHNRLKIHGIGPKIADANFRASNQRTFVQVTPQLFYLPACCNFDLSRRESAVKVNFQFWRHRQMLRTKKFALKLWDFAWLTFPVILFRSSVWHILKVASCLANIVRDKCFTVTR